MRRGAVLPVRNVGSAVLWLDLAVRAVALELAPHRCNDKCCCFGR